MSSFSKTAYILGYPVSHSRSPLIHTYWLQKYGLDGDYVRREVPPEELSHFIHHIDRQNFLGGNITVPHKENVFKLLQHISDDAKALSAVNTLYWDGDNLVGDNTDGYGFIAHLNSVLGDNISQINNVLIMGAGGAARPIVHSLLSIGVASLKISNRTKERAEKIISDFKTEKSALSVVNWNELPKHIESADLIVNTTSLGMTGQPPLQIDLTDMRAGTYVYDIVYAPIKTELLKQAEEKRGVPIDGLGMLLHQAVPGFERWFGVRPEVTTELRDLILADLEQA